MYRASATILNAFKDILSLNASHITKIGRDIPIPIFSEEVLLDLNRYSQHFLQKSPIMERIVGPIIIVGDLHGSLHDLIRIFAENGVPPKQSYLFLGDYIDRGPFSVEVITLLMALQCEYRTNITLLRGNHEFRSVNSSYGFKDDLMGLYGNDSVWESFNISFDYFPLCAIINCVYFCVHGGISSEMKDLKDIEFLQKPIYDTSLQIVEDMVWADPSTRFQLFNESSRGHGKEFGPTAVNIFLENTGLTQIFRAHQCVDLGIDVFAQGKVVTVFSASSYKSDPPNKSAIIKCDKSGNVVPVSYGELPVIVRNQQKMFHYIPKNRKNVIQKSGSNEMFEKTKTHGIVKNLIMNFAQCPKLPSSNRKNRLSFSFPHTQCPIMNSFQYNTLSTD